MRTHRWARWLAGMALVVGVGCGGAPTEDSAPEAPPPAPEPNRAPTLGAVSATRASLDEGSALGVSVSASDPDGDPLTYTWTQSPVSPAGTFSGEEGSTRTWTAPLLSSDTTFTVKVTVSDGKGGTAQGSVLVTVVNVPALNQAPVVDEDIVVDAAPFVAGKTLSVFVGARDRDGDPLTYVWKTSPAGQGAFTNPGQAFAQWRSGEVSAATDHTLQVTVSDGSASVTRTVKVRVGVPAYARDIEPIWSAKCADCHNQYGAERLNLLSGQSHASLVDTVATGACRPLVRVSPGRPENSLLMQRLTGGECGNRMPQGNAGYFDEHPGELIQIRSWILAGARND